MSSFDRNEEEEEEEKDEGSPFPPRRSSLTGGGGDDDDEGGNSEEAQFLTDYSQTHRVRDGWQPPVGERTTQTTQRKRN